MTTGWLARYLDGETVAVWAEMVALDDGIRADRTDEAKAVAEETMSRVARNVDILIDRLQQVGYQFQRPDAAHVSPSADTLRALDQVVARFVPIPLSLDAFYRVVGSVNFTQSWGQLVHYHRPERSSASEVEILGEQDPLVVLPLDPEPDEHSQAGAAMFFFAPDEFHKANYSGGENYHVLLPDASADFPIHGMYGLDELFVSYLRLTFLGGGFRGRIVSATEDYVLKPRPDLRLTDSLAEGLLLI
jgi:hypothetical protein